MVVKQLTVDTLGGLRVLLDGHEVAFETRKDAALFVYLVATDRPHPRETLAEMFWEGYSQADAQRNFRRMLSNLRQTFGDFMVAPRGDFVSVDLTEAVQFDFAELESQLVSGTELLDDEHGIELEGLLKRYQGNFLEGFYVDSPDFERWVTGERERLLRRVLNGLRLLVNDCRFQPWPVAQSPLRAAALRFRHPFSLMIYRTRLKTAVLKLD